MRPNKMHTDSVENFLVVPGKTLVIMTLELNQSGMCGITRNIIICFWRDFIVYQSKSISAHTHTQIYLTIIQITVNWYALNSTVHAMIQ